MRTLINTVLFLSALATQLPAQTSYFPKGAFSSNAEGDEFRADWYSKHLKNMDEPSLLESTSDRSVQLYRFIWLRTFHHPVVIRLQVAKDGTGILITKVSDGAGGYETGKLVQNTVRHFPQDKVQAFIAEVDRLEFWKLPSFQENPGFVDLDGSQWIIEGAKDGEYHVVDRWSPKNGPIRDLGITLVFGLAQLKIPKDTIY